MKTAINCHIKLILVIAFTQVCLQIFATDQEPDRIYYKGKLQAIGNGNGMKIEGSCYPLQDYEKRVKWPKNNNGYSTACFRGYVATWKLQNDSLFLVRVDNNVFKEIPLEQLFPDCNTSNGIFAFWYKGFLRIETVESVITYNQEEKKNGFLFMGIFKNGIISEIGYIKK